MRIKFSGLFVFFCVILLCPGWDNSLTFHESPHKMYLGPCIPQSQSFPGYFLLLAWPLTGSRKQASANHFLHLGLSFACLSYKGNGWVSFLGSLPLFTSRFYVTTEAVFNARVFSWMAILKPEDAYTFSISQEVNCVFGSKRKSNPQVTIMINKKNLELMDSHVSNCERYKSEQWQKGAVWWGRVEWIEKGAIFGGFVLGVARNDFIGKVAF